MTADPPAHRTCARRWRSEESPGPGGVATTAPVEDHDGLGLGVVPDLGRERGERGSFADPVGDTERVGVGAIHHPDCVRVRGAGLVGEAHAVVGEHDLHGFWVVRPVRPAEVVFEFVQVGFAPSEQRHEGRSGRSGEAAGHDRLSIGAGIRPVAVLVHAIAVDFDGAVVDGGVGVVAVAGVGEHEAHGHRVFAHEGISRVRLVTLAVAIRVRIDGTERWRNSVAVLVHLVAADFHGVGVGERIGIVAVDREAVAVAVDVVEVVPVAVLVDLVVGRFDTFRVDVRIAVVAVEIVVHESRPAVAGGDHERVRIPEPVEVAVGEHGHRQLFVHQAVAVLIDVVADFVRAGVDERIGVVAVDDVRDAVGIDADVEVPVVVGVDTSAFVHGTGGGQEVRAVAVPVDAVAGVVDLARVDVRVGVVAVDREAVAVAVGVGFGRHGWLCGILVRARARCPEAQHWWLNRRRGLCRSVFKLAAGQCQRNENGHVVSRAAVWFRGVVFAGHFQKLKFRKRLPKGNRAIY